MRSLLLPFSGLAVICLIILSVYFYNLSLPASVDTTVREFSVNQGDGILSIAKRLQKNQFINSHLVFIFFAYKMGLNQSLQAGDFRLSSSQSIPEIVKSLTRGGSNDHWLKIVEGMRSEEVSLLLDGFDVKSKEGRLYPDSYSIPNHYTPIQILEIIEKQFKAKFSEAKINATSDLSDQDTLILASLLEREARTPESKQTVAGILHNRLKIGMALQVDATVQYARDSRLSTKTYWLPINKTDLSINSLFNTYKHPGLPPTPICNPGFDSIYAAFHPASSDYLYYITGHDNKMHYARTLDEHNANIAKYLK